MKTPQQWQHVEEIFHAALGLEPSQRAEFLAETCANDPELRAKVESLIAAHERPGTFINSPAYERVSESVLDGETKLPVGRIIGRYEVLGVLGKGGMGEVYLARDLELGRKAALKILPEVFTKSDDRLRRFKQEARAASALNHPNIITIYEVGASDSTHFIATEHIEGLTLSQRMRSTELTLGEALDFAIQTAGALAAAHAAGIVHRDIKPDNIMVRPDGYVKILDFGIAKLTEVAGNRSPGEHDLQDETARAGPMETALGVILGSPNYMSPEQARGLKIDPRTDIFSLGVLMYEMVTGRRPFEGLTLRDVIVSILSTEPPPLAEYRAATPPELERIVTASLAKDREERYQTCEDLLKDLKRVRQSLEMDAAKSGLGQTGPVREALPEARDVQSPDKVPSGPDRARKLGSDDGQRAATTLKRRKVALILLPLALVAVVISGVFYLRKTGKPIDSIDSVAVLPFTNESNDPDMDYLSVGITENLINSLSQLLKVMPRNSVSRYKGEGIDPQKVGRDLNVGAVLTGKVLQRGETLNIQSELVDVATGTQLWGERYNRKKSDLLAVEEEIANEISGKLQKRLTGKEEKKLPAKRYTENAEAYQLYLRGRYYVYKYTEFSEAIEYFNQAIALDPSYALPYAGLAEAYFHAADAIYPPNDAMPKSRKAARKALEIDERLAEAHVSMGQVRAYYEWNWPEAEREFKRAIELKPEYATAHHEYAVFLGWKGRMDEANSEIKRALELESTELTPESFGGAVWINTDAGNILYWAGQYDRAIGQYHRAIEMDPNFWGEHLYLGMVYDRQGFYADALTEYQKAKDLSPGIVAPIAGLGHGYAVTGKRKEARRVLDELTELSRGTYVSSYYVAIICAGLGENDQAFAWLNRAFMERSDYLVYLNVEPLLDSLRTDPRFGQLVRRVGLTP